MELATFVCSVHYSDHLAYNLSIQDEFTTLTSPRIISGQSVFATSLMSIQDQFTTPTVPSMFSCQSLFHPSLDKTLNRDL
jgi:hypothetical protein